MRLEDGSLKFLWGYLKWFMMNEENITYICPHTEKAANKRHESWSTRDDRQEMNDRQTQVLLAESALLSYQQLIQHSLATVAVQL